MNNQDKLNTFITLLLAELEAHQIVIIVQKGEHAELASNVDDRIALTSLLASTIKGIGGLDILQDELARRRGH